MAINKQLAEQRNLSEETISKIEEIHIQLEKLLSRANLGVFNTSVYNAIEQQCYALEMDELPLAIEVETKNGWLMDRCVVYHKLDI